MSINKFLLMTTILALFATSARADCLREEQIALAQPEMRQDLRGFHLGDIEKRDAASLKTRLQAAEARSGALPEAALYACLARLELQKREGSIATGTDDPKARGRSARVM
jgi:hypothetical protein